jgi:2-succinyl-5-enolpyruvyl-6-hydroxy-3-cyclohexene-1-carboxylate synthase
VTLIWMRLGGGWFILLECGGAFKEVRELDFQEPMDISFEFAAMLFRIGHRVLGTLFSHWL